MENTREHKEFDARDYLAYAEDMLRAIYDLLVKDAPNSNSAATLAQVTLEYIERAERELDAVTPAAE